MVKWYYKSGAQLGCDHCGVMIWTAGRTRALRLLPETKNFLLFVLVIFVEAGGTAVNKNKKPNVLFIVADDLGWNDVSWHNRNIHSPVIEGLAAEGVLLDQYYVMPTCTPSRVAMMTGKYPYKMGRQHMYIKPLMPAGLPVNVKIMPQYFKEAGYATHAIGKWHLGYCHANYTPTFRGFDTFYGFYMGSQDYYLHNKILHGHEGYDFRLNEQVLRGPEVEGKYSSELFAKRAKSLFKKHKKDGQPWFTYLSLQSVHDPLQVPHAYFKNVCKMKNSYRHFYHAMVSAMDHAVQQVVQALKQSDQYSNTIIVFTTDNGGAQSVGGNNMPLRGTKGTLFEGGTRAIGFVHSPLLLKNRNISRNLMHAVDWLPTLLSAIGTDIAQTTGLDGIDQWPALTQGFQRSDSLDEKDSNVVLNETIQLPTLPTTRVEVLYNIKEVPFMAALRVGRYKLIWGSRTEKDIWYLPNEEPINEAVCQRLQQNRTKSPTLLNSDIDISMTSARTLNTIKDENEELWQESRELEKIQKQDYIAEERSFREGRQLHQKNRGERAKENDEENEGGNKKMKGKKDNSSKRGNNKKNSNKRKREKGANKRTEDKRSKNNQRKANKNKNKRGNKKNKKKTQTKKVWKANFQRRFTNKNGVEIKPWGEAQLYDLEIDPEEKSDISTEHPDVVENLKDRIMEHFEDLIPKFAPDDTEAGNPSNWGNVFSPGWCDPVYI